MSIRNRDRNQSTEKTKKRTTTDDSFQPKKIMNLADSVISDGYKPRPTSSSSTYITIQPSEVAIPIFRDRVEPDNDHVLSLAKSMLKDDVGGEKGQGQVQPGEVIRYSSDFDQILSPDDQGGKKSHILISGLHRLLACKTNKINFEAKLLPSSLTVSDIYERNIIENTSKPVSAWDMALHCEYLNKLDPKRFSQRGIARLKGVSPSVVNRYIRIASLNHFPFIVNCFSNIRSIGSYPLFELEKFVSSIDVSQLKDFEAYVSSLSLSDEDLLIAIRQYNSCPVHVTTSDDVVDVSYYKDKLPMYLRERIKLKPTPNGHLSLSVTLSPPEMEDLLRNFEKNDKNQ
jgi:hypothetical protein